MLHEYRDLIAELRQSDNHFARLFNEHNALDEEINRMESDAAVSANSHQDIESKKTRKTCAERQNLRLPAQNRSRTPRLSAQPEKAPCQRGFNFARHENAYP